MNKKRLLIVFAWIFLVLTIPNIFAFSLIPCCNDFQCGEGSISTILQESSGWQCLGIPQNCTMNQFVTDNCVGAGTCGYCWYMSTFCMPDVCKNMGGAVPGTELWEYCSDDGTEWLVVNSTDCSHCSRRPGCPDYDPALVNTSYIISDPLVQYNYQPSNRKIEVTTKIDSNQNAVSRQFFDGLGRQIQTQSDLGNGFMIVSNVNYDLLGRTNATTKPYQTTAVNNYVNPLWLNYAPYGYSRTEYDSLGRPIKMFAPGGDSITNTYTISNEGFVTATTDELGRTTRFTYDAYGNLINVQEPDGNVTRYEYDVLNRLIKTTDAKNNIITYEYNGLGQLKKVNHPDEGMTQFTYDTLGNLKTKQIASGEIITYNYDGLNRIVKEDYPDNTLDVLYSYDEYMGITPPVNLNYTKGKLTKVSSAYETDYYFYDAKGRLGKERKTISGLGTDIHLEYSYDDANNLLELKVLDTSGTILNKVNYQYDKLSRVKKVYYNGTEISNYNYTASNLIKEQRDSNNVIISFTYSIRDRLEQISSKIFAKKYIYDKSGNIVQEKIPGTQQQQASLSADAVMNPDQVIANYAFDLNDRLKSASYPDLRVTNNYSYDKTGNRIKLNNINYNIASGNNRIASDSQGYSYLYDLRGNLISKSRPGEINKYTWDLNNHLLSSNQTQSISPKDGAVTTKVINYYYNYKGDRIKKVEGGIITSYIYDSAGNLIFELSLQ